MSCAAKGCRNARQFKLNNGLSFHRFPLDPERLKIWKEVLGLGPNWVRTNSKLVCSKHFKKDDYKLENKRMILKKTAIPTIRTRKVENSLYGFEYIDLESSDSENKSNNSISLKLFEDSKESKIQEECVGNPQLVDGFHSYSLLQRRTSRKIFKEKAATSKTISQANCKIKLLQNRIHNLLDLIEQLKKHKLVLS